MSQPPRSSSSSPQRRLPASPSSTPPSRQAASSTDERRSRFPTSPPKQEAKRQPKESRNSNLGVGLVVFFGSLLGTLIGLAADLGDAQETVERLQRQFFSTELCIAGSNTILGDGLAMAQDWGAAFEGLVDARVRIRGIGSVNGVNEAATGGCVHVLAMSEPMTDAQFATLTRSNVEVQCAAQVAYDVIAIVTNINNRIAGINPSNLRALLNGLRRQWSEVGGERGLPVRILARPGSGTTDFVLAGVALFVDPDPTDDRFFPPNAEDIYIPCNSNDDCLNKTLTTPGSLYWVSSAWMRTQPERYQRVIPIVINEEDEPINPLRGDIDLNDYFSRLVRPLYLYVLDSPAITPEQNQLARQFLDYVRSVPGQQIVEQYGFYTFFAPPANVSVPLPPGFSRDPVTGLTPVCRY